jgi:hypothetical protein
MEVSGQYHDPTTLPRGQSPLNTLGRRVGEPVLDAMEKSLCQLTYTKQNLWLNHLSL